MTLVHDVSCEQARAHLAAGEGSPLPAGVADHLARCPECAARFAEAWAAAPAQAGAPSGQAQAFAELAAPLVAAGESGFVRRLRRVGRALPPRALAVLTLSLSIACGWLLLPRAPRPEASLATYLETGLARAGDHKLVQLVRVRSDGKLPLAALLAGTRDRSEAGYWNSEARDEDVRAAFETSGTWPATAAERYAAFRMARYVTTSYSDEMLEFARRAGKDLPEHPVARAEVLATLLDRDRKLEDRGEMCRLALEARMRGLFADAPALQAMMEQDGWDEDRWCSPECAGRPKSEDLGTFFPSSMIWRLRGAPFSWHLAYAWARHVVEEEATGGATRWKRFATPEGGVAFVHAMLAFTPLCWGGTLVMLLMWIAASWIARRGTLAYIMSGDAPVDHDRRRAVIATSFGAAMLAFSVLGGALGWIAVPHGAGKDAQDMVRRVVALGHGAVDQLNLTAGSAGWLLATLVLLWLVAGGLERIGRWSSGGANGSVLPVVAPLVVLGTLATPLTALERESGITGPIFLALVFALATRALGLGEHRRERMLLGATFAGCFALATASLWGLALHHKAFDLAITTWFAGFVLLIVVLPALVGLLIARLPAPLIVRQRGLGHAVTGAGHGFVVGLSLWAHVAWGGWGGTVPGPLTDPLWILGVAGLLLAAWLALALGLAIAPDGAGALGTEPGGRVRRIARMFTDRSAPGLVWVTLGAATAVYFGL
jgi:hypothetical protein